MPAVGDQHRGGAACITMPNTNGTMAENPFEEPQRRMSEYTAQQIATLQARLDKKLGPEYISSRPGAAGQRVHYLAADKCINLANEVFGFNGWSSSIVNIQIDFVDENPTTGKISLGLSVIVRVTLKDGTYHEDIGYGHIENCKGKAAAFEKAKKEGTTDALKRSLRNFGNVLGNCIYDKEYVSKVTKVKAVPAKWDINELHRHPDFAPVKKEPAPPKRVQEDDDLPPQPAVTAAKRNLSDSSNFDGDGEFGSDLFDEADFGVAEDVNPDEIVIGPDTRKMQQPPTPFNGQNAQRGPNNNPRFPPEPNTSVVTPSKPERFPNPPPAARHVPPPALTNRPSAAAPNFQNGRPMAPGPAKPNQDLPAAGTGSAQVPVKREPGPPPTDTRATQDMLPPGSTPSASFFSARAVDLLRDNPQGGAAPAFDPHAESPSIRKTAGVDHTKSVPISKPMLAGVSPASNNTRDFVNPSSDVHRKIGVPGGAGMNSPLNRNQSTSSYRPLTRPNVDPKNPTPGMTANRPQNINGKRPPLNDVTNASNPGGSGPAAQGTGVDPKRPKIINEGATPPQQQQPQQ
ncbi:RAD52 DNA repair protein [Aspergillus floccosus]